MQKIVEIMNDRNVKNQKQIDYRKHCYKRTTDDKKGWRSSCTSMLKKDTGELIV